MEFFRRAAGRPNRLGILPGTFNPVTVAHLALAHAALRHVDEVVFVLPRVFPHKNYTRRYHSTSASRCCAWPQPANRIFHRHCGRRVVRRDRSRMPRGLRRRCPARVPLRTGCRGADRRLGLRPARTPLPRCCANSSCSWPRATGHMTHRRNSQARSVSGDRRRATVFPPPKSANDRTRRAVGALGARTPSVRERSHIYR